MSDRDFGFYLKAATAGSPAPELGSGGSGYFSHPASTLDPHLFNGMQMIDEVRHRLIDYLFDAFSGMNPESWIYMWLAGSGITYQWAASRGNGDLDVLVGIDYIAFMKANKEFLGISELELADHMNDFLRSSLWPSTSATDFNGQIYEVTYYVNPGTGDDIRNIHPYAAYDLLKDSWTVTPPVLPDDPATLYDPSWAKSAAADKELALKFLDRYNAALAEYSSSMSEAGRINASSKLRLVTSQARALFDDIHLGRKEAFREGGKGFGDWHNYRWQASKQSGAMELLHSLSDFNTAVSEAEGMDKYGEEIAPASEALRRAILWRDNK